MAVPRSTSPGTDEKTSRTGLVAGPGIRARLSHEPHRVGWAPEGTWFAVIKQLADLARDENLGLPLFAFGHSTGSALTQAHIENHSDLLAGAILCGTLGAVPGADEDDYPGVIAQLQALRAGPWRLIQDIQSGNAESHPNLSAPSSSR